MFSYYGSKSKIIDYYPKPQFDRIIEPFAGSARYSLKYFEKDVLLVDKFDIIVNIWKYLQECSPNDILSLPSLKQGDKICRTDFDCMAQAYLFGFMITQGTATPMLTVSKFGAERLESNKKFIANNLFKIKHWQIELGDYATIPNQKATWFIDPPYQKKGYKYRHNKVDFEHLANYSTTRKGQVIVCEQEGASWLNFNRLVSFRGSAITSTEVIFTNTFHPTQNKQLDLAF